MGSTLTARRDEDDAVPAAAVRGGAYRVDGVGLELPSESGAREILRAVSLEVVPGEFVGIVGRSGTGKTTLLRILGGLVRATGGEVLLDGKRLSAPPATVVTVFQDYSEALLPWRTVARNVSLGLEGKVGRDELRERTTEALRMVRLEDRADEYPWRLSGGMQQRVQIARALALRPRVLLMDEPFGALDAMTKAALQDELLSVRERTGATILFITHDVDEAIYLSERVLVISGQPGTISASIATELPHPRDQLATRELPRYLHVRHALGEALGGGS